MIDLETYLFDSLGMYHKKNAIPIEKINEANLIIEESGLLNNGTVGGSNRKIFGWETHKIFLDLMLHDSVKKICNIVYGEDYRLDHAFLVQQSKTIKSDNNIHGETHGVYNAHYYHSYGQTHIKTPCLTKVGQLSVGIILKPQSNSTGGLCYIPGSHKSSYLIHGNEVHKAFLNDENFKEVLHTPTLNMGDIVAFPESIIHGSTEMLTEPTRLILYAMFFPMSLKFNHDNAQLNKLLQIADPEQKKYLETFEKFKDNIHSPYIKKRKFVRPTQEWM